MGDCPALPHIYFRPWQSFCHARRGKAINGCRNGKRLLLDTGIDATPCPLIGR